MNYTSDVPMLDGQFVNLDLGTGIVHCAPSHGADDFNLCLKNNIPSLYTVNNVVYILKRYILLALILKLINYY